jgi:uncharacterized membrane protein (DUF485 family)
MHFHIRERDRMKQLETMESNRVTVKEVLADPQFRELVRKKNSISILLTLATMAVYYGFIFLIAFDKALLAKKITENVTLGIPVGIGVILITCVFTGIYVKWANGKYDPAVTAFKRKLGEG